MCMQIKGRLNVPTHLALGGGGQHGGGGHGGGGPREEAVAVHAVGDEQRGAPELALQNGAHRL